ncbi:DUF2913 family protein [Vibrio agarivorans]|uniref:DUF2913 family protein n=1 Tax=Vibrio agarivorans TaxID=153622 RepID=UPI0025B449C1|nr:DUF2913 family protein [Vibrio agarivorans]MDN3661187.1 DUF2913 family protein [Vibrio agarivorans]
MTTSNDFTYYNQLQKLVNQSLLHLYMHIAYTSRIVPTSKRNEILLKYLKPKLKDKRCSAVKKDVRVMIRTARSARGDLEKKLWELDSLANKAAVNGAEKLYSLIEYVYQQLNIRVELFNEDSPAYESRVCYVLRDHIENCFDDENKQVAPLSLLVQGNDHVTLIDAVNSTGLFRCELHELNTDTNQAHLLLHPA